MLWVDSRPNHKNRPENLKWSDVWVLEILEIHGFVEPPQQPNNRACQTAQVLQLLGFPSLAAVAELVGWDDGTKFFLRAHLSDQI